MARRKAKRTSKKKAPAKQNPPPEVKTETPVEEKPIFAFPSKVRCPECKEINSKATSTQGQIQYRQCLVAYCGHTWKEIGTKI